MLISVLCVDGKPIPCEYVEHGRYKERRAKIIRITKPLYAKIETDGSFTKNHFVLTGSTTFCKIENKWVWGPFLGRYEATIGKDIRQVGINFFEWHCQESLFDYLQKGSEITFFEF